MAYEIKITGLANKNELVEQGQKGDRLYKFSLSGAPDGFWVLLLQGAGQQFPDVTLSANADQQELWASVQYIPQGWDWSEIESNAETAQRLEPLPEPAPKLD